jgi:WD40 repeat protein/transcriptional regulator with XRE-family HTH domain
MDASEGATSSGDRFRGLVLVLRGRAGLTQRALAAHLGISGEATRKWESGEGYPSPTRLQALIALYLERGVFTAGREAQEAAALWEALRREAARHAPPFDVVWFSRLRPTATAVPIDSSPVSAGVPAMAPERTRWQTWGEAPDVAGFQGRQAEVETLGRWLVEERCRLVAVLGLGGIGKTALATHAARALAPQFAGVCWRSLRNAPPPEEWLGAAISALTPVPLALPDGLAARLGLLHDVLRERRCLLVLDNLETVLEPGMAGRYRAGYEGYGAVLRQLGESVHQSTLLLTGREEPPELALLAGVAPVRTLHPGGLDMASCRALLRGKGLLGDDEAWQALMSRCGGNPLVLSLVGQTIAELFGGEIEAMLAYAVETVGAVVGGVHRLLEEQFGRLSALERSLLYWLAVEREPVGVVALRADLAPGAGAGAVLEALEALGRRSLLEPGAERATHTLQPVVLEYVSERLVEALAQEIMADRPVLLVSHAVVQATGKDYVRRSQERLLAQPLLERVVAACGDAAGAERQLVELLMRWRGHQWEEQGYGPGNVVNLLRLLRGDLRGLDLSRLSIRQAFLADVEAQNVSLAFARLSQCVFAEAFDVASSVALSADGRYVAAGGMGGTLHVWHVVDRTVVLIAGAHNGTVRALAITADGKLIATGGTDGMVRLWTLGDPNARTTWRGHTSQVTGLALSADGQWLASCGNDGKVTLWEAAVQRQHVVLEGHAGAVYSVALSADGQMMASSGADGTVRLWDTRLERLRAVSHGHEGGVWSIALSADGGLAASGGSDATVRLWNSEEGQQLAILQDHTEWVYRVALSADGKIVASGSYDGTVRLWDVEHGHPQQVLSGHRGLIWGTAISGDGHLVASGGADGVRLWDAATGQQIALLGGHLDLIFGVALSAAGDMAAVGSKDGTIRIWDTVSERQPITLRGHRGMVWGLGISADGRFVASVADDGTVRLWNVHNGQALAILRGHSGAVRRIALSADGKLAVSAGTDGTVRMWDTGRAEQLTVLRGHRGVVWGVAVSATGELVASSGDDGTVRLWNVAHGEQEVLLHSEPGMGLSLAMSASGEFVASGGYDGTIRMWGAEDGRQRAELRGHDGGVFSMAFSSDGRLLASGGYDKTVRIWDVVQHKQIAVLRGHDGGVMGMGFSTNGTLLISGSTDGTAKLWHAEHGSLLRTLRPDRPYERMTIEGLAGVTEAQRVSLLALGADE